MNEEEKAKRVCDAIDALLRGEEPEMELDDQELVELLRIARLRHRAGQALANVGLTYQELLRRVLRARMVARQMEQGGEKVDDAPPEVRSITDENPREFLDPLDPGYGKLVNFLDFQPRPVHAAPVAQTVAAQAYPVAACQARPTTRTLTLHWSRGSDRSSDKAEALSDGLDRLLSGRKRTISVGDPDIDELLQIAQLRRFVGQSLAAAGSPYKRRLWAVLRMRLATALRRQAYAPQRPSVITAFGHLSWRQAAAAAAAIALMLAALGPLPATGFADHPVAHLINLVGERVGVEEVDGPPPSQIPTMTPGEVVPLEEAQSRLGLSLREPSYLPEGFDLASSLYYPQSATSPERGTFVLIYTIGGVDPETLAGTTEPRLLVYQESATSADVIRVESGQAEDVLLAGSVPGTYARALWAPGNQGSLEGTDPNAESLLFNNDGVRVVITYRYGDQEKEELLRIAESMLSQ